jgi:hypothetical protein
MHRCSLLGWTDIETYDELFDKLCWRYHPAVASILAHDIIVSREASLRTWNTRRTAA